MGMHGFMAQRTSLICKLKRLLPSPTHLPRSLTLPPVRHCNVLDSVNSVTHAWRSLLECHAGSYLYSPLLRVEGCSWLPLSSERGAIRALESLHIQEMGELFIEGRARRWEEVSEDAESPSVLTQFHFHRLRHSFRAL